MVVMNAKQSEQRTNDLQLQIQISMCDMFHSIQGTVVLQVLFHEKE